MRTGPADDARLELLSRADCHLCDEARAVVRLVAEELGTTWTERDIDAGDADLRARYGEYVPVVFVDGVQQGYWQIDPDRLRRALRRRR